MTHRAVVDRIEGELAVLEINGITVDIPVSLLPDDAREGRVYDLVLTARDEASANEDEPPAGDIVDIQL